MASFNNDVPTVNLTNPSNETLNVPEFPSRNGPQRLAAAATKQPRKREKIRLEPGHSPLDWAKLTSSGKDLRGVSQLEGHTMERIKKEAAWTVIHGKVYNLTAYLKFHPGGEKELLRCAGRDGTKLFMLTHSWVNIDYLLEKCLVGFLVPSN
ncbi:cytochrome b5-like heme/steroid binding domain-containing protein [Parasitella parasitica]|nr:cytochrome b5-like heme/steroid binding domain-containing protein [Parasitella parasitica]